MTNLRDPKYRYAHRLIQDWRKYGKIVIATEFEGVIKGDYFNDQEQCNKHIAILKLAKEVGAHIVVFTASDSDRYMEISVFCAARGLSIDTVNKTPIELPYGGHDKVQANWYLDSHSPLDVALDILEFACYTMRGEQHSANFQTVEF